MYKLYKNPMTQQMASIVIRLSDGAFIPFDAQNSDYQQFLKYQAEGGKVYGADEEIPADEGTQ
jgi:hypothetical protein